MYPSPQSSLLMNDSGNLNINRFLGTKTKKINLLMREREMDLEEEEEEEKI